MQSGARGAGGTAGVHARILRGHPISPERQQKPVVTLQQSINKCLGKSMKVSKVPAPREAQGGQWEVEMLWSSGWQQDTEGGMCQGSQGSLHSVGPHRAVGQEGCSPKLQKHPHFCKKLYAFLPAYFWENINSLGRAWIFYSGFSTVHVSSLQSTDLGYVWMRTELLNSISSLPHHKWF